MAKDFVLKNAVLTHRDSQISSGLTKDVRLHTRKGLSHFIYHFVDDEAEPERSHAAENLSPQWHAISVGAETLVDPSHRHQCPSSIVDW